MSGGSHINVVIWIQANKYIRFLFFGYFRKIMQTYKDFPKIQFSPLSYDKYTSVELGVTFLFKLYTNLCSHQIFLRNRLSNLTFCLVPFFLIINKNVRKSCDLLYKSLVRSGKSWGKDHFIKQLKNAQFRSKYHDSFIVCIATSLTLCSWQHGINIATLQCRWYHAIVNSIGLSSTQLRLIKTFWFICECFITLCSVADTVTTNTDGLGIY